MYELGKNYKQTPKFPTFEHILLIYSFKKVQFATNI